MTIGQLMSPVLALLAACAFTVTAMSADTPPVPKPASADAAPADAAGKPPFIVHNPDGTMTVQKEPARGKTEEAGQKGLVIPPQVVVPTVRMPANDRRN
jgi:hypothetical protein